METLSKIFEEVDIFRPYSEDERKADISEAFSKYANSVKEYVNWKYKDLKVDIKIPNDFSVLIKEEIC